MTQLLPVIVRDRHQAEYTLETCLGEGGQGAVYRVKNQNRAVKIYNARGGNRGQQLEETLAFLRRLPLKDLCIARPLTLLAHPNVGYVMELMTGMESLKRYLHPPRDAEVLAWYIQTGGLARRLRLLARTAKILAELHAKGMVFVDLSPNNVFASEDPQFYEVWLIDPDNIRQGTTDQVVYTPGYAPPEFFRPQPFANSLTDAWSFAVLAFEMLNLLHPFCGDLVQDGPPEREEEAFQGKLPFVDDKQDSTNEASLGLPRDLTLTPSLRNLFQDALGEGRRDPLKRPGLATWAETLARAADQALTCPECSGSFYYTEHLCPWCDTPRPPYGLAKVYLRERTPTQEKDKPETTAQHIPKELFQRIHRQNRNGGWEPMVLEQIVLQEGATVTLTGRHFGLPKGEMLRLHWAEERVELQACDGEEFWLLRPRTGGFNLERLALGRRSFGRNRLQLGVIAEPEQELHRLLLLLDRKEKA